MENYDLYDICQEIGIEQIIETCVSDHIWGCDCPTGESLIQTYCIICFAKNPILYTYKEFMSG